MARKGVKARVSKEERMKAEHQEKMREDVRGLIVILEGALKGVTIDNLSFDMKKDLNFKSGQISTNLELEISYEKEHMPIPPTDGVVSTFDSFKRAFDSVPDYYHGVSTQTGVKAKKKAKRPKKKATPKVLGSGLVLENENIPSDTNT